MCTTIRHILTGASIIKNVVSPRVFQRLHSIAYTTRTHLQQRSEHSPPPRLDFDRGDVEPGLIEPTQEAAVTGEVLRTNRSRGV